MECIKCDRYGRHFGYAKSFNQPIGNWNVLNVTEMGDMFWHAKSFNQPILDWDVSNVTDTGYMFYGANAMQSKNKPKGLNYENM